MSGKHQQTWKNFFYSNVFLGLIVGALIFIAINILRVYYQNRQVALEVARLQAQTQRLESKKLETLDALKFTESSSFVEEKARIQFNLVKPGESVAIIAGHTTSTIDSNFPRAQAENETNYVKWKKIFFKNSF